MLKRPAFKPHYRVRTVTGEGILLLSEKGEAVLCGPLYELVAPYLDGRLSPEEIATQLRDAAPRTEVLGCLEQLEKEGHLTEGTSRLPVNEAAWWSIQGIDPLTAAQRLQETPVSVIAFGSVDVNPFQAALESLGVRVEETGDLEVVLTDDYLHPGLSAYNEAALNRERPWLLFRPVGCEVWLGPLFRPEQTGCWECLAQRLRENRGTEALLAAHQNGSGPLPLARSFTPATQQIAWNLAANKVAEWVVRGELEDLQGQVLSLDVRSLQTQFHSLVWRPQCPACGVPETDLDRPAEPVVLASRRKTFLGDGSHRALSPQATLERYGHHVSPITGAVSRLQRHGLTPDGVIHAYQASHNFAMPFKGLKKLRAGGLRSHSGGKGTGDLQARAGGLCEALERYSGVFRGDEPRRRARFKDLGPAAIHPNDCMRFSDRQYQEREAWNARQSMYHTVPRTFDENSLLDWSPVWSLTGQQCRWLPTAFCYYGYPMLREESSCVACSNGAAAGNTMEEAILQGFLELVERDSVALWWYNRVRRPAVDLDSFHEPYLGELRDFLASRHRDLWVLDLTSDLEAPAFAAVSRRTDRQPEHIMVGFGAHLDPRVGVLRAVTELNQMLAHMLRGPDEVLPVRDGPESELTSWLKTATLRNQPYLEPHPDLPARQASSYPRLWSDDLREDVLICQGLAERQGLEMLVLDQTRADIGLPVVKVMAPGLRHFWARFAPGRLYDAPVKLGWLPQLLREEELNPIPMFL